MLKMSEAIKQFSRWRQLKVKKGTVSSYYHHIRYLCLYLHNPDIEAVELEHILEYLEGMKELEWDNNGFEVRCIAFKKFFEFMRKQGYKVIDENLIPIPGREYRNPRVATKEEWQRILKVIPEKSSDHRHPRNRAILGLLYDTGARVGEICSLDLSECDFVNNKAVVKTEKARTVRPFRYIMWSEKTNEWLKAYLPSREKILGRHPELDHDGLFVSITGRKSGQRLERTAIAEFLRQYSRKAEIYPTLNAHSFRHLMAHDILEKTDNIVYAKEVLGHATIVSTQHYLKLDEKEVKKGWQAARG